MSSPALQAHLDPAGKVLDDPPAFLPWNRSYCCLQVRGSLGVVAIHPVLKVSPHIKIWWFKCGECSDHCLSHLRLISRSGKRCCSHTNDPFEVWGVAPSCWKHLRTQTIPLRGPSAVQNLPSTWTYRSVLIVTDRSPTHRLAWAVNNESLTAATSCGVLDDFGCPLWDCLLVSLRLRLCAVPWVLNLVTHLLIIEWTGNSRHPNRSLNCNWAA